MVFNAASMISLLSMSIMEEFTGLHLYRRVSRYILNFLSCLAVSVGPRERNQQSNDSIEMLQMVMHVVQWLR